jgi:hypothetical protein
MEQLDVDANTMIDSSEAEASPGLSRAFARLDTNQDKQLSESEIRDRFAFYEKLRTGLVSRTFQALLNGRPVADAKVEFIPEEFQGGVTEVAVGLTDYDGMVMPTIANQDRPAMQIGFYRVVLYPDPSSTGQPLKIESPVGVEVSPVSEPDESGNPILRFKK